MKASWIFSANDVIANLGVILAGLLVALPYFAAEILSKRTRLMNAQKPQGFINSLISG